MANTVVPELGGWWSGVLHPFDGHHVVLMLIVAALAGIAATQGREPWVGPVAFVGGTFFGVAAAGAGIAIPFIDGAIGAGLLVGVALMFAPPPKMSQVLPLAAVLGGVLHGLSTRDLPTRPLTASYVLGFLFTTVLLQAFGAIVGSLIGRSVAARRVLAVGAAAATAAVIAI
jgi:hydrogenase/urease accessory protein HupE